MSLADVSQLSEAEQAHLTQTINERISEQPDQFDLWADSDVNQGADNDSEILAVSETESLELNEGVFGNTMCGNYSQTFSDDSALKVHPCVGSCKNHASRFHIKLIIAKCFICDRIFSESSVLKEHMLTHSTDKIRCTICFERFSYLEFEEHLRKPIIRSNRYHCKICSVPYLSMEKFNDHMDYHDKNKTYKCNVCFKGFYLQLNLNSHLKEHSAVQKLHKCRICSKSFTEELLLKEHTFKHISTTTYQCQICYQVYLQEEDFKEHLIVHTGQKTYQCTFCDSAFYLSTSLDDHLKNHLIPNKNSPGPEIEKNKKRYKCQFCQALFTQNFNLNSHLQRYHFHKEESQGEDEKLDLFN